MAASRRRPAVGGSGDSVVAVLAHGRSVLLSFTAHTYHGTITPHTQVDRRGERESHHTCPATFCRHVHRGESNPASFFAPCASPPQRRGHRSRARGLVNRMGGSPRRRVLRAPDDQKGSAFASRRVGLCVGAVSAFAECGIIYFFCFLVCHLSVSGPIARVAHAYFHLFPPLF